jgi:subtilisin
MRRFLVALAALPLVAVGITSQAIRSDAAPQYGRYVVVLNDSADPHAVAQQATGLGAVVNGLFGSLNSLVATLTPQGAAALRSDPRVRLVTQDIPMRITEAAPSGVARIGAQPRPNAPAPAGGVQSGVAVIDTGISEHPDLNIAGGVNCASDPLGDLLGGLLGGGGKTNYSDSHGHGTHVAGTVAAKNDNVGVVGVSPGAPLYAVKVFGALGAGNLSDVICGLDWVASNAAANNIKVVNMSLGGAGVDDAGCGEGSQDALHLAVCRVVAQGVTVVVAAGNSKVNLVDTVPASYDEVLTVSAMTDYDGLPGGVTAPTCADTKDQDDTYASFSNWAVGEEDAVHVVSAPGVCISSTWKDGGFQSLSGTSMASPHVAGLVARCIDAGPCAGMAPAQIIQKIRADAAARPAGTGFSGDPTMPFGGESRYYGHLVDSSAY